MADVQKQFNQFDEKIKLGRFDENVTLRDKRDIIREKLEANLPGVFEKHGEVCPEFKFYDQGSYDLGTGTKPLDGDFDIDQGLYFEISTDDYPDPVVLKKRVHEALDGHTRDVSIRRSCVTVQYQKEGEPVYHVDVAVYSEGSANSDGKSRLAKGREHSSSENRVWEVSKPRALKEKIREKFGEVDRRVFRRSVRFLKRWRDENFPRDGHAAPLGIGLTVATYDELQPAYLDYFAGKPDDLTTMRRLVEAVLSRFVDVWDDEEQKYVRRIYVYLPVEPGNELFSRMSNAQSEAFEVKLKKLQTALDEASSGVDPVEACKKLRSVFGDGFPVPNKEDTGQKRTKAISSSSESG